MIEYETVNKNVDKVKCEKVRLLPCTQTSSWRLFFPPKVIKFGYKSREQSRHCFLFFFLFDVLIPALSRGLSIWHWSECLCSAWHICSTRGAIQCLSTCCNITYFIKSVCSVQFPTNGLNISIKNLFQKGFWSSLDDG